jgi:centrosomin
MAQKIEDLQIDAERLQVMQSGKSEESDAYPHATKTIKNLREQIEKITGEKNEEIEKLQVELKKRTQNLQGLVNKELWEKNREIERLTQVINNLQNQKRQMRSLDGFFMNDDQSLSNSFNESHFNDAMEKNKKARDKINQLVKKLYENHDRVSKHDVDQLKSELQLLNEEHEKCEVVRKNCVDLCGVLSDRLEELSGFLGYLLQHADVLALLGKDKKMAMQQAVNRSLDLSRSLNVSRLSMLGDHSLAHLDNNSVLNILDATMGSTRESMDNVALVSNLRAKIEYLQLQLDEKSKNSASPASSGPSGSEVWSEPDRNVSMARMGLEKMSLESDETEESQRLAQLEEKLQEQETLLAEKNEVLLKIQEKLLQLESESQENLCKLNEKLQDTLQELADYQNLKAEHDEIIGSQKETLQFLENELQGKESVISELKENKDKLNQEIKEWERQCETFRQMSHTQADQLMEKESLFKKLQDEIQENYVPKNVYDSLSAKTMRQQDRMAADQEQIIYMQSEITKIQGRLKENEVKIESLQEELDDSLDKLDQLSEERKQVEQEKSQMKKQISELREEIDVVKFVKDELQAKVDHLLEQEVEKPTSDNASGYGSEEVLNPIKEDKENLRSTLEKPLLKTLEISEDRKNMLLSNSVLVDPDCLSCTQFEKNVKELRKEIETLKNLLASACRKLSQQNQRKAEVEKNIKKEILKTKDILENVRSNMENQIKKSPNYGTETRSGGKF